MSAFGRHPVVSQPRKRLFRATVLIHPFTNRQLPSNPFKQPPDYVNCELKCLTFMRKQNTVG
jgi:hypothetical protein